MKNGLFIFGLAVWASACSSLAPSSNKTPLTPMGELNACVLEQVKLKIQNENAFNDINRTANQAANYCIRTLDMMDSGLYGQAVLNATSILNSYKN